VDFFLESLKCICGGQLVKQNQECCFIETALLSELLDGDSTLLQDAFLAIDETDFGFTATHILVPVVLKSQI